MCPQQHCTHLALCTFCVFFPKNITMMCQLQILPPLPMACCHDPVHICVYLLMSPACGQTPVSKPGLPSLTIACFRDPVFIYFKLMSALHEVSGTSLFFTKTERVSVTGHGPGPDGPNDTSRRWYGRLPEQKFKQIISANY